MASLMGRAREAAAARAEACSDDTAPMMFVGFDVAYEELRDEAYKYAGEAIFQVARGAPVHTAFAATFMSGFVTGLHFARLAAEDARKPTCAICGSPASPLSGRVGDVYACSAQCAARVSA